MFIYITTNEINKKRYIGMCTRDDSKYIGSGVLLKQAIKKYGRENFSREVVEHCKTFEELCDREKYWIDYYNAVESNDFYNVNDGGLGGNTELLKQYWRSLSKEERQNIRNWKPYFKLNPPKGSKNPMYGKSTAAYVKKTWDEYSTEERQKRLDKMKAATAWDKTGKNNPMYGRSAIREKNLKWYTNGKETIYVTEGTQPRGFIRGRKIKKC